MLNIMSNWNHFDYQVFDLYFGTILNPAAPWHQNGSGVNQRNFLNLSITFDQDISTSLLLIIVTDLKVLEIYFWNFTFGIKLLKLLIGIKL